MTHKVVFGLMGENKPEPRLEIYSRLRTQCVRNSMRRLNKLMDGFEGKLTSSKWAKIAKCSRDTATRDIQDLIVKGILVKDEAGGKSTNYLLTV